MSRLVLVACVLFVALSCAKRPPEYPEATGPIDWAAVAEEKVPVIATKDKDGDLRATKLWIVVVDGQGIIRTGRTYWLENIEQDPKVVLYIGGAAYPLRAELIEDESLEERAQDAFREKYGWQDRLTWEPGWWRLMRLTAR
jgi:hypothetical protein